MFIKINKILGKYEGEYVSLVKCGQIKEHWLNMLFLLSTLIVFPSLKILVKLPVILFAQSKALLRQH